jgi:hypothetical protein
LCVACARNKLVQSPWRTRSPLSFRGDFALSRLRPENLARTRSRCSKISAICDKNLVRRELLMTPSKGEGWRVLWSSRRSVGGRRPGQRAPSASRTSASVVGGDRDVSDSVRLH